MSARDELRGTLGNTICNASNYARRAQPYLLGSDMSVVLDKTADAIMAAGYRKPRTITCRPEVDAASAGTVIRTYGGVILENWPDPESDAGAWEVVNHRPWTNAEVTANLPATVIYEPEPTE